jgi:type II secretory pathway pseudopilin PulG
MIAIAIIAISALALITSLLSARRDLNHVQINTTMNLVRMQILSHMKNDSAWKATVDDTTNSSLNCIRTNTSCAVATTRPFKLNDSSGSLIYDSTLPSSGFGMNGVSCSTYNDLLGSDNCPIRVDLSWEPECTAPCVANGLVRVSARIKYNAENSKVNINALNYDINFVRQAVVP